MTTLKSAVVCRDLARAKPVYVNDDTVEAVDRRSIGRALVGYLWICCLSLRKSPASPDYLQFEK